MFLNWKKRLHYRIIVVFPVYSSSVMSDHRTRVLRKGGLGGSREDLSIIVTHFSAVGIITIKLYTYI